MTFNEFLLWLGDKGISAAIGFVLYYLAEHWEGYQSLSAKAKRLIFAGACMAIPLASATAQALYGYASWDFENTFWPAIQSGFLVFLAGTVSHTLKLKNE